MINIEEVIWIGRIYTMKNRKQKKMVEKIKINPMNPGKRKKVYGTTIIPDDDTIRSNEDDMVQR